MLMLALVVLTGWPQQQCVTAGGNAACGYDCKTAAGEARCARTPLGRCVTTAGEIFCNDPPNYVLRAGATEQMMCVTSAGTAACGYDCKSAAGTVACAQTPWGRCVTTAGRVFCGDPSKRVIFSGEVTPVECRTSAGNAACGYDCKTAAGTVACASVPWGRCITSAGRVVCSE
jgi:hypothetical protein